MGYTVLDLDTDAERSQALLRIIQSTTENDR
jgi:hypothetical protein